MPFSQLFYTQVMASKEAVWGTPLARNVSIPAMQPSFQPMNLRHVVDQGYRNLSTSEFDVMPGPGEGGFSFGGNVYVDSTPILINNLFGIDSYTGILVSTPHVFTSAKAPPSLTMEWGQNTSNYLLSGARLSQLSINFSASDGALTYQAQGISKLGVINGAPSTFLSSVVQSMMGWQGICTIAGSAVTAALMDGAFSFSRPLKVVHSLNQTQDAAIIYAGPLSISAQLNFDYSDNVVYNYFASLNNVTKNALVVKFIQLAGLQEVWITIPNAAWRVVTPQAGDQIYMASAQVTGVYSASVGGPGSVQVIGTIANATTF